VRETLQVALHAFLERSFRGAILPFTAAAGEHYGEYVAARRRVGRPVGVADAIIAAIALDRNGSAIATRDLRDFEGCGLARINPFENPGR
jgi:predicted nucleic acid-binding protein